MTPAEILRTAGRRRGCSSKIRVAMEGGRAEERRPQSGVSEAKEERMLGGMDGVNNSC